MKHKTNEWALEHLGVKKELLGKVKSTKMKHNSLEKEAIQVRTPQHRVA